ncbi:MAG: deoxyribose-phosphate aldolase [[Lactobacillus] timonensis]|jgi:deoxyribose-phosphate aldolase|uniref:deoxyribose-phosphate aldolase n=1 Tax=[Lactobacillus] timonensis TaxID=1970790 RepID=UPI0023553BA4|nr:deoxyribose-phosphate aldolase [[Lactobacillus] timonensis]MCI1287179.1 deoxyribose-phosphate aldolase [[Lactobacillus] timonensis]MCI1925400.1 deoxyribose-phosphate aldolase [[Lactobacillus] timonensis]MCI1956848.1 deoxyribose-phosphate aldolase [[Lactobacillus] timonensis]MCI1969838.1 deoxyribose-phosphate aldolase [[Lactobacillus] timonensis]MCI2005949.1 deoxyribose-phosphate aldolase [[Lactobacillus] timonensis]
MQFNQYIDHTLLAPDATEQQVENVVQQAIDNHFHTVMINPYWVAKVHQLLAGTDVKTACVIGFPLGANTTKIKVAEAEDAIANGVDELDMVMNIGEMKSGHEDKVEADIQAVVGAGHAADTVVKVIIETCLLTDDEITRAAKIVAKTGADFVKTSTGFSTGGATVHAVKLMAAAVQGTSTAVKASGGIHTADEAQAMIDAGATRLGVSHSMQIIGK